jgi:hypothetical protein
MTRLPYSFDLLYDIKTVEELHMHLTGERRSATSGTDAELIELCAEYKIPLPQGVVATYSGVVDLAAVNEKLLDALTTLTGMAENFPSELHAQHPDVAACRALINELAAVEPACSGPGI